MCAILNSFVKPGTAGAALASCLTTWNEMWDVGRGPSLMGTEEKEEGADWLLPLSQNPADW